MPDRAAFRKEYINDCSMDQDMGKLIGPANIHKFE